MACLNQEMKVALGACEDKKECTRPAPMAITYYTTCELCGSVLGCHIMPSPPLQKKSHNQNAGVLVCYI